MTALLALPILLPLVGAGCSMIVGRSRAAQRAVSLTVLTAVVGVAVTLLVAVDRDGPVAVQAGGWAVPMGITLVADRLSALMVLLTALLGLIALAAAHGGWDERGEHFHPLLQIQLMGLNGAFLTGDLFNLFVFFEVLLIASYGLLVHGNGAARVAAGLRFVTLNLVGSSLFLVAAALLYGVTGTLNLADLSQRIPQLAGGDATLARAGAWILLTVFCLKAAILPLYFWLPGTYAAASPPVAALFAVMTKVGIYAVLRVFTTMFGAQAGELADTAFPWIVAAAAAGYGLAMLGALAGGDLRRLAAMLLIGSAAFLLIGIGLRTERSIAAAVYYLPHTTLSAAALFLVADLVARGRGALADRLVAGPAPLAPAALGLLFVASAVAIAGLPPLGGFVGKAMLLAAMLPPSGVPTASAGWLWAAVLGGSLLSMIALARAGSVLFWKSGTPAPGTPGPAPLGPADYAAPLAAIVLVVAIAGGAAPLQRYAQATARDLLDPASVADQVLRSVPKAGPHQPRPESFR